MCCVSAEHLLLAWQALGHEGSSQVLDACGAPITPVHVPNTRELVLIVISPQLQTKWAVLNKAQASHLLLACLNMFLDQLPHSHMLRWISHQGVERYQDLNSCHVGVQGVFELCRPAQASSCLRAGQHYAARDVAVRCINT
jgi:hypothetical protein